MAVAKVIVIFFVLGFHITYGVGANYDRMKLLMKTLFDNYNPMIRPVAHQTGPTTVNLTLQIAQIDNLSLKRQTLKWAGWIRAKWYDELLTWNASQYQGRDFVIVPQSMIWLPDYVLDNDVNSRSLLGAQETPVYVNNKGVVTWEPPIVTETRCKVDIRKYPFDEQTCHIDIAPWMSNSEQLQTNVDNQTIAVIKVSNGEFIITSNYARSIRYDTFDDSYAEYRFFIHLSRRTTFYWLGMIFPMVAVPFLCPISFLLPADCGEKITLAITVVLSYLVFIGSLKQEMPELSDSVSLVVLYATVQLAIGMMAVVANGAITCLSKMSPDCNNMMSSGVVSGDADTRTKTHCLNSVHGILYRIFKYSENKHTDPASTNYTSDEKLEAHGVIYWTVVARKLDKICFILFMSISLISTTVFGILIFK